MTKFEVTNYANICRITSDNYLFNQWVPKSPARKWMRLEKFWGYPITELRDLTDFLQKINETFWVDPKVQDELIKFSTKVEIVRRIKEGEITDFNITKPALFKTELTEKFQYQYGVISQMLLMRRALLVLDVGLGKTIISLYTILKLREMLKGSALIICESNQIHKPWLDTLMKFTDIKDYLIVEGDAAERQRKIAQGKANLDKHWLWIASYDTVKIEWQNMNINWTTMVLDEITKVKNVSTDAFKALDELDATYKFGLSATPVMTNYFDLYGIMKTVNPDVFTNKDNFTTRYLELDWFGNPKGVKEGMEEELKRKVYPWTVQVRKKDVGQVKPKEFITLPVPLVPLQQVELDRINSEIANGDRTAFESGTVLRQICNTLRIVSEVVPVLDSEGNAVYDAKGKVKTKSLLRYPDIPMADSTNKVAVLKDILKKKVVGENKKVVVFSFFKTAVSLLEKELLQDYRVKTITGDTLRGCKFPQVVQCNKCPKYRYCKMIKKEIWEFVEGDVQVLLGTDSLSRAHNLYTCDTIINFDLPWSSADLEQRIGRIDRANNVAEKLHIINLVTLGTIEERIIKIIETKQKESDKVFPAYNVSLSRLSSTIKVK